MKLGPGRRALILTACVLSVAGALFGTRGCGGRRDIVIGGKRYSRVFWSEDTKAVPDGASPGGTVNSLAFSLNDEILMTGVGRWNPWPTEYVGEVAVWDLRSRRRVRVMSDLGPVQAIDVSPDSRMLAIAQGGHGQAGRLVLVPTALGEAASTLETPPGWVRSVRFSPDGKVLLACGAEYESTSLRQGWVRGWVRVIDIATAHTTLGFDYERESYRCVVFSADGRTFAAAGAARGRDGVERGRVRVWRTEGEGVVCKTWDLSQSVECVAFTPSGEGLATGGMDGVVRLWGAFDGELRWAASLAQNSNGIVTAVSCSADGSSLLAALGNWNRGNSSGQLLVLDVKTGGELGSLLGRSSSPITCATFSHQGKLLSAASDGNVMVWTVGSAAN
jgi:WD40 repeat protein